MNIQRNRLQFLFAMTLLFISIIFPGCSSGSKLEGHLTNMHTGSYLVSFSKEYEKKARFIIYQNDGSVLEDVRVKNGQALYESVQMDNGYMFVSRRINTHLFIDNTGDITSKSFLPEKYDANRQTGTFFAINSQDWLISAMNVGGKTDGYLNEIVYQNGIDGLQKSFEFKKGLARTALVNDDKLYLHYYHLNNNDSTSDRDYTSGIYIFDLKTDKEIDDVHINNLSLVNVESMKCYHQYLLLYGDSTGFYKSLGDNAGTSKFQDSLKPPCLGVFDTKNNQLVREVYFEEDYYPVSLEIYDDNIYILSDTGKLKRLDGTFKTIQEYQLSDNASRINNDRGFIAGTFLKGSDMQVIYRFFPSPSHDTYQLPIYIGIYDLQTGALKQTVNLKLNGEKEWWEEIHVQPLNN